MLPYQRFWITSDHYDRACGRVAWVAGDHDTSVERLGRAAAEFLDAGALPYASHVLADLAEAAWVAVMPKVAADAARAAEDVARQLGRPHFAALAALAGGCSLGSWPLRRGRRGGTRGGSAIPRSRLPGPWGAQPCSVGALPRDAGSESSGRAAARGGYSGYAAAGGTVTRRSRRSVTSVNRANGPPRRRPGPGRSPGARGDHGARRAGHERKSDR